MVLNNRGAKVYMDIDNDNLNSFIKNDSKKVVKVVTSGSSYMDIDAYGGCIAYAELLRLQGYEAKAVSSSPLNESITPTIQGWDLKLNEYEPKDKDEFILIDVSNNKFFDPIVVEKKIVEIIDHHVGFEEYWEEKLGKKANIEFIGSACTLVFEKYKFNNLLSKISYDSARLIATGILDNTLNFESNITTERDISAYKTLAEIANLPEDWPLKYFSECQKRIESNLEIAINNDVKTMEPTDYLPSVFGQLVVWKGLNILQNNLDIIEKTLRNLGEDWMLNLISISDGKSYIVTHNNDCKKKLNKLLNIEFKNGVGTMDKMYLRKEIIKKSIIMGKKSIQ